jgi:hypothetical protein
VRVTAILSSQQKSKSRRVEKSKLQLFNFSTLQLIDLQLLSSISATQAQAQADSVDLDDAVVVHNLVSILPVGCPKSYQPRRIVDVPAAGEVIKLAGLGG